MEAIASRLEVIAIRKQLGARMLLGAPGLTTRSKKLLGAPGIATRNKDATRRKKEKEESCNIAMTRWSQVMKREKLIDMLDGARPNVLCWMVY